MKSISRFLPNRMSCLVRGLLPIPVISRIVRKIGGNLLSRRDFSTKILSYNIFVMLYLSIFNLMSWLMFLTKFVKVLFETFDLTRRIMTFW